MEPTIFFAQSLLMKNGYCDLMSDPVKRQCHVGPFFSSPELNFKGEKTGSFYANNALWMHHNRYFLESMGNEHMKCPSTYLMNTKFLNCLLETSRNQKVVIC